MFCSRVYLIYIYTLRSVRLEEVSALDARVHTRTLF